MSIRKICVITGTRAEYGLLYWLMKEIESDPLLKLQLVVTGMHLSPEFGLTYKMIELDGFQINEKVEMILSSDTPIGIGKSMGLGIIGFTEALYRLSPDVLILLGDRYEILAAAQAALVLNIPIAHLSGGESTEGAIDDAIRHALTKLSHLHFVGAEEYRRRVIQMGEAPEKVFNYGDIGLDNIRRLQLMIREELEESLCFSFGPLSFLVTYHPITLQSDENEKDIVELLSSLEQYPQANIIFTMPNSDAGGRLISHYIDQFVQRHSGQAVSFKSMGQIRYLSALREVDVVIGNSSSGIVEAPYFKTPTVNIGKRQQGRLRADSIIDCLNNREAIVSAIDQALSKNFHSTFSTMQLKYESGNTAWEIKECIKNIDNLGSLLNKKFYDIRETEVK
jgi:UDP-hydrolysing UDP-N-acetyl-D-glucosamine 2-epimerase